ncbi:YggS family pyridoxal phosphate-dependent enzyme [Coraliomargarita akajimensis]|uniref:Pyridoxal phosphate homeostasis protein n=1 Tax=Coraliomargarita akajimensis (strain DSM 45221 / IAM 15411 / JCM 23193 / KCTC 12865 / 04OKA010-24) TaxID=583355 RepID=D5EN04_CORAD|nr:YggS family pyridoxal phosphate-dependent enzyme [Coraliomargarita akajimensis]ADE53439.1 alanine racemase domain protein [Coraliomargarita akajimensis DSM 45221]
MIEFSEFEKRLGLVQQRIVDACRQAERRVDSVHLLPVTKNHPLDAVLYAARSGLAAVGENRVQEALDKKAKMTTTVRWELIGHLQSNKAKDAVEQFDRIQSVDSLKLLQRLDRMAAACGKRMSILLQCNAGEDPNKYGFSPAGLEQAVEVALNCSNLQLDGLMTIAPLTDNPDVAKACFERLRTLRDHCADTFSVALPELSMGMTGDLDSAIAAGSTQIRVGTALYGSRGY